MAIITPKNRGSAPERRTLPTTPRRVFPGRPKLSHFWRRRLLRVGILVVLVGLIGAVAIAAWVSQDLPDPNNISSRSVAESTKIYARDGKTVLYDVHGTQRRTVVELRDISENTKNAVISIEDKDFYKHNGISLRRTIAAILIDIFSGSKAQGGSTLTQQLVKNTILTTEKSYIRKIKEWILSYQIERRFSKDQILKMYLNQIPLGSSYYGVEAASEAYFNVSAKNMSLAQSALLAAMIQRPSYFSPNGIHTDELLARQQTILGLMVKQGYITQAQADEAKAVDVLASVAPSRDPIIAPHFVFTVRDLLVQKYGEARVQSGGLRVITTLDTDLQKIAEEEVVAGAEKNVKRKATNAALVAVDPKNGQILTMVGSKDFFDTAHDGNFNVATAVRNPGSSFKPIVYLSAFTKGYSPDTLLFDLKTDFGPDGSGKNFIPSNYDGRDHGPLTMRKTLAGSLNIPAVKTLYLAGIQQTAALAEKLGYTTIDGSKAGLAMAIGGSGVKLVEHVGAFATLANDGTYNPITYILRVEDRNGKVLEKFKQNDSRAVDEQYVRQLQDVMSDNNARAYVFGTRNSLTLGDRPVAAKTGTTNDNRDGWTMGFVPSLAAGVWVGNNDNSAMRAGSDGVVVAAPIWRNFMQRALKGKKVERFTAPKPVEAAKLVLQGKLSGDTPISVDTETGKQIPDSCLAAWPPAYVQQVAVKTVHDILFYVNKDDPNGPVPDRPENDPMYTRWEAPVAAWAKKHGYVGQHPGFESCSLRAGGSGLSVTFLQPTADSTVSGSTVSTSVDVSSSEGVSSVVFTIDGGLPTTVAAAPWSATLDASGLSSGYHTIAATATTAAGATATASVRFNLLNGGVPTVYISSPTPKQSFSLSSFPRTVTVVASDPSGVALVTLYSKEADGTTTVLNSVASPSDTTLTVPWSGPAGAGTFQLYVVMKNAKGATTTSDPVGVTVTP